MNLFCSKYVILGDVGYFIGFLNGKTITRSTIYYLLLAIKNRGGPL